MSITFMHNFHTKISTVKNLSPGINYTTLTINYATDWLKLKPFKLKGIVLIPK